MTPELTALLQKDKIVALAVMRECARLVCPKCASLQYALEFCKGVWRHINLAHTEYGHYTTTVPCDAAQIHAAISEAEAAQ